MIELKTLFDSFNARNLTIKQVVRSFIIHPKFIETANNGNSLLLGPRGCGKTTLLKMLTIDAQLEYEKIHKEKLLPNIPFFAIYIPTDIQWKIEVEHLQKEFENDPELLKLLLNELVNTNIYSSTIATFVSLINRIDKVTYNQGIGHFVDEASKILNLSPDTTKSLYSIEQALSARTKSVNVIISKYRRLKKSFDDSIIPDYYHEEFFDVLIPLCNSFEHYFGDDKNSLFAGRDKPFKWALCFDELELAPEFLQKKLIRYLRSKNQNFIFKLTSIPIINLMDIGTELPSAGNDYTPINLWLYNNSQEQTWEEFCTILIKQKLENNLGEPVDPNFLFGDSSLKNYLETVYPKNKLREIEVNITDEKKFLIFQMRELAKKDKSFVKYLESKKGLDLKTLIPKNRKEDSEIHRKIAPIVVYRNHNIKQNEETKSIGKRTRRIKNPFCYGWPDLCKISDGNPRLIIGVIDMLLLNQSSNNFSAKQPIDISAQANEVYIISKRYLEIWGTHPNSNAEVSNDVYSLKKIIDKLGNFFSSNILTNEFTPSPVGTFTVDAGVNEKIIDLIKLGLYLGAFVMLNPSENLNSNDIIGQKFRLSFILYPYYLLPIRVEEKPNVLSKILKRKNESAQKELWMYED